MKDVTGFALVHFTCNSFQLSLMFYVQMPFTDGKEVTFLCNLHSLWQLLMITVLFLCAAVLTFKCIC